MPGVRRHLAYSQQSAHCARCQHEHDDIRHHSWECLDNLQADPKATRASLRLLDESGSLAALDTAVYYHRCLVPARWTSVTSEASETVCTIDDVSTRTHQDHDGLGTYDLNGSGTTPDIRTRRCGRSTIKCKWDPIVGTVKLIGGWFGSMATGQHTVPCAELYELVNLAENTSGDIRACSDNLYVVRSYNFGRHRGHGMKHQSLWSRLARALETRQ